MHRLFILLIVALSVCSVQEILAQANIYLSRDFWNYVYVIDATVIVIKPPRIIVEVNKSWTEEAEVGDTLVFSVPNSGRVTHSDGSESKPIRTPFRAGDNYLFISNGGLLTGYGYSGDGFYRLNGFSGSSFGDWWGWEVLPSIISETEIDSLAVHIGNNAGFDSREYHGTVAFPSGERVSIQDLNDYCLNNESDKESIPPIEFHLREGRICIERADRIRYDRISHLRFVPVVDSVRGSEIYQTFIPRSTLISASWITSWIKGRDLSFSIPAHDCVALSKYSIPTQISLVFSGLEVSLYFNEVLVYLNWNYGRSIPISVEPISMFSSPYVNASENSECSSRIRLDFQGLETEPYVPVVFTIEKALYHEAVITVSMYYSDSLNSKFYPAFTFNISLPDSLR